MNTIFKRQTASGYPAVGSDGGGSGVCSWFWWCLVSSLLFLFVRFVYRYVYIMKDGRSFIASGNGRPCGQCYCHSRDGRKPGHGPWFGAVGPRQTGEECR